MFNEFVVKFYFLAKSLQKLLADGISQSSKEISDLNEKIGQVRLTSKVNYSAYNYCNKILLAPLYLNSTQNTSVN